MRDKSSIVYLALGSNLGDRAASLRHAMDEIAGRIGVLSAISSVMQTEPWGFNSKHTFLNMVVRVETRLSPTQLLKETQSIEKAMGRPQKLTQNYLDRIIDIDIILYDTLIFQSEDLQIPHPLFHKRRFVLQPLNEIAPDLIHPVQRKTITELLTELS